jgi:hypothetical protein
MSVLHDTDGLVRASRWLKRSTADEHTRLTVDQRDSLPGLRCSFFVSDLRTT